MRLPPGTKKDTEIEVAFNIDANGVLEVKATNKVTGKDQKITVTANGGLSEADVKRMLEDAEKNAEADRIFKERQMAAVNADEQLKEAKQDEAEDYYAQASDQLKQDFQTAVKELTEARDKKDVDVMIAKTTRLKEVRIAIGEAFNAASAPKTDAGTPPADALTPDAASKEPPAPPKP